jgi:hypothetical protein
MALTIDTDFRMNGVRWRSGHIYTFRYNAWQHDPNPTIILMYRIRGIHPNTGHQWRLIQGINFSYIPRSHRKVFASQWLETFAESNGNAEFTYSLMKRRYPWMSIGIRRYLTKPAYYIQNPEEIPPESMEDAIIDTWMKDFSKKVKLDLMKKYRSVKKDLKKHNKNPFGSFLKKVFRG